MWLAESQPQHHRAWRDGFGAERLLVTTTHLNGSKFRLFPVVSASVLGEAYRLQLCNYLRDNLVTKGRKTYCKMAFELLNEDEADKTSQGW